MLSKLLVISFLGLLVTRLLFFRQLRAFGKWFEGFINALLIAIALAYALQLVLWLTG
ncbi:MAG TPA: hypothetical protein VF989_06535 [Polyangiaceae bacterium]|jgi:hypothetical protein